MPVIPDFGAILKLRLGGGNFIAQFLPAGTNAGHLLHKVNNKACMHSSNSSVPVGPKRTHHCMLHGSRGKRSGDNSHPPTQQKATTVFHLDARGATIYNSKHTTAVHRQMQTILDNYTKVRHDEYLYSNIDDSILLPHFCRAAVHADQQRFGDRFTCPVWPEAKHKTYFVKSRLSLIPSSIHFPPPFLSALLRL